VEAAGVGVYRLIMLLLPLSYLNCFLRDPSVPVSGCPDQRGNFTGAGTQGSVVYLDTVLL
jgi:hypothetical protein